jgi:predicted anti-sigma-YlaC factor YlaD
MPHIKEEQISAYIDGQLGEIENQSVEMHLRECESCQAVLNEMGELTNLFREAERSEPSPFLWNRIAADLNNKESSSALNWKNAIFAGLCRFGWNHGVAAAALCILMIAGVAVFREININIADRAALTEIDRAYSSLTAQGSEAYNPFSSSATPDFDANPFRSIRGRTDGTPSKALQH